MSKDSPNEFKAKKKLELVLASEGLKGEELGAFVRRNGIYASDLIKWKEEMMEGLDGRKGLYKEAVRGYEYEIEDLRLKLKQTEALLDAKKKLEAFQEQEAQNAQATLKKKS